MKPHTLEEGFAAKSELINQGFKETDFKLADEDDASVGFVLGEPILFDTDGDPKSAYQLYQDYLYSIDPNGLDAEIEYHLANEITIFTTAVLMESQEQCNRFKKLCLDYKLSTWLPDISFEFYDKSEKNVFCFTPEPYNFFANFSVKEENQTLISESEWIELLKKHVTNQISETNENRN